MVHLHYTYEYDYVNTFDTDSIYIKFGTSTFQGFALQAAEKNEDKVICLWGCSDGFSSTTLN